MTQRRAPAARPRRARGGARLGDVKALRRELLRYRQAAAREVRRQRRAVAELSQATETLSALHLAGTHLSVETDDAGIYGVICRELLRIGFPSAVLTARHAPDGPHPPYQYAYTSFTAPVRRATERILGTPLAAVRVDPASAPLVAKVLQEGRTIFTARARAAARQLLGDVDDARMRKLERLLALKHVVIAPLRYRDGISGLLVVAAARLRRTDPKAIDAFALHASIALEKARLFAEMAVIFLAAAAFGIAWNHHLLESNGWTRRSKFVQVAFDAIH